MDIVFQALLLGTVEGLTEFLPVSSTGHLILLGHWLDFQGPPGKSFEIAIQLGAILALCVVYRQRLLTVALNALSDQRSRYFLRNILLGFLPAVIIGVLAYRQIHLLLDSPLVVALALIIGGLFLLALERLIKRSRIHAVEEFSPSSSVKIGIFQCLAMIPGVSRSGATIMGALLVGADRKTAAEFSFFLAIPTMLGATLYTIYKNWSVLNLDNAGLIVIGFITAFVVALFVVRGAIALILRYGFTPFAWYRIFFGGVMLLLLFKLI